MARKSQSAYRFTEVSLESNKKSSNLLVLRSRFGAITSTDFTAHAYSVSLYQHPGLAPWIFNHGSIHIDISKPLYHSK